MNTIILTSYNRTTLLEQAIKSALAQTVPITLMIIDDGSPQPTIDIIEKYAVLSNVIYIQTNKLDKDRGKVVDYSDNINTCLKKIKEGNIFYLVCDDYYSVNHVELLSEALNNNPSWKVVFGAQEVLQYDDKTKTQRTKFYRRLPEVVEKASCRVDHIQIGHRIELIDDIGFWPTDSKHYGAGDAAFWNKINKKYPFHRATTEITNYNRHHIESIQSVRT